MDREPGYILRLINCVHKHISPYVLDSRDEWLVLNPVHPFACTRGIRNHGHFARDTVSSMLQCCVNKCSVSFRKVQVYML